MGFIFVSAGHGGFERSLRHRGAVQAPEFIRAQIKNIVSDNQPPDTSVKSLSSNLKSQISNLKSQISNLKSIDLFPLPLDRRHLGYKCATVLPIF